LGDYTKAVFGTTEEFEPMVVANRTPGCSVHHNEELGRIEKYERRRKGGEIPVGKYRWLPFRHSSGWPVQNLRRLAFEAELLRADIFSLRLAFVPVSDLKQRSGRSWASRRHRLAPCSVPGR